MWIFPVGCTIDLQMQCGSYNAGEDWMIKICFRPELSFSASSITYSTGDSSGGYVRYAEKDEVGWRGMDDICSARHCAVAPHGRALLTVPRRIIAAQ